jgi:hypothetical protein
MTTSTHELISFLREDLSIPVGSIPIILKECEQAPHRLPVVLWQSKLIRLSQLDHLFTWMIAHTSPTDAEQN